MTKQDLANAVRRLIPLLAVALLGTACADLDKMMHKETPKPAPTAGHSPPVKGEFAPFQIKFKADGTPVVVGQDGRPLRGVRVNFPRKPCRSGSSTASPLSSVRIALHRDGSGAGLLHVFRLAARGWQLRYELRIASPPPIQ
jgi:hypothetical protein